MVLTAIALRLFAGFGLTAALGASHQLPNATAAFAAGLATPFIVARFFQSIPLTEHGPQQRSEASIPAVRVAADDTGEARTEAEDSSAAS